MPWPKPTLARYIERFWRKVDKTPGLGKGDCWLWRGGLREGYGAFYMNGHTIGAHRVAWFIQHRRWPHNACHTCDVRTCVRLSHIFNGTPLMNAQDARNKGRTAQGIRNFFAELTNAQVLTIRRLYAGGIRQTDLAIKYGVHPAHISSIVRGRTWQHLPLKPYDKIREYRCGSLNTNAKLTESQVRKIRSSQLSQRKLGEIYGVSHTVIGMVQRRMAWWHV